MDTHINLFKVDTSCIPGHFIQKFIKSDYPYLSQEENIFVHTHGIKQILHPCEYGWKSLEMSLLKNSWYGILVLLTAAKISLAPGLLVMVGFS